MRPQAGHYGSFSYCKKLHPSPAYASRWHYNRNYHRNSNENLGSSKPGYVWAAAKETLIMKEPKQKPNVNGKVSGVVSTPFIQPKLTINQPGDAYEREADAMAERVMRMTDPAQSLSAAPTHTLQRKCSHCEEEDKVQRKETGDTSSIAPASVHQTLGNSGQPLSAESRSFFEPRFGQDFSGVRIHTDGGAAESARDIKALAYTSGQNVVFGRGQYQPESASGQRLLAHELTHVVQQNGQQSASVQRSGNVSQLPGGFTCPIAQDSISETMAVLFEHNSSHLTEQGRGIIGSTIDEWWNEGANALVRLDGYASEEGSQQLNWTLSCERVNVVYRALQQPTASNSGIPGAYVERFANGVSSAFGSRVGNRRVSIALSYQPISTSSPQTTAPSPTPVPIPRTDRSDRRSEYELERDRRRRTPEGGRSRSRLAGQDLDSDWAGRAILGRYLSGTGEWTIFNDSNWNRYMMADSGLKEALRIRLLRIARTNLDSAFGIDETFPAKLANGEGIIGYQYLHGTNATVGGFKIRGAATNVPDATGGRIINFISLMFTWNDVIDPNPQYGTDTIKSMIAEAITLGAADAYTIHITWITNPSLTLDSGGGLIRASGYPFD